MSPVHGVRARLFGADLNWAAGLGWSLGRTLGESVCRQVGPVRGRNLGQRRKTRSVGN